MNQLFKHLSHSSQRYLVALLVLFFFSACSQTPAPDNNQNSTIQASDENGNNITTQAVPTNGLKGDYYNNMDFTGTLVTRYDANVNRNWGTAAPIAGIANTTYSVRWTGQILPQYTQKYTFFVSSSDGARLMVNGQALVNDWVDGANRVRSGTVDLVANTKYDIRLEYYRNATNAGAVKLEWQSQSRARQVVPQAKLFPTGSDVLTAIQILNALPSLQSKNLRFDFLTTGVIRTPDRFKIFATDVGGNDFLISEIKDQKVSFILRYAQSNATGAISELISGVSADLGDMSAFVNGTSTNADSLVLMKKIANFNANFGGSTISVSGSTNTIRPQYIIDIVGCDWIPPPPPCTGNCDAKANDFRDSTCQLTGGITEWILASTPIPTGRFTAFFLGARVFVSDFFGGASPFDITVLWNKRSQAWKDYLQCLKDNADKGCQPELFVSAQSISLRKKINSSGVIDPRVIFQSSSSSKGTLSLQWTTFGDDQISGISNGNSNLAPGQSIPFVLIWSCPSTPTILHKTITLTHNAGNLPSPMDISIRIECVAGPKISATPNPLLISTPVSSPPKTGVVTITNTGDAPLEIDGVYFSSTPANGASLAMTKAPSITTIRVLAPQATTEIEITGTCGSTPTTVTGTITISSNAVNTPNLDVPVTLRCTANPEISVSKPKLMLTGDHFATVTDSLIISSVGQTPLTVDVYRDGGFGNGTFAFHPSMNPYGDGNAQLVRIARLNLLPGQEKEVIVQNFCDFYDRGTLRKRNLLIVSNDVDLTDRTKYVSVETRCQAGVAGFTEPQARIFPTGDCYTVFFVATWTGAGMEQGQVLGCSNPVQLAQGYVASYSAQRNMILAGGYWRAGNGQLPNAKYEYYVTDVDAFRAANGITN